MKRQTIAATLLLHGLLQAGLALAQAPAYPSKTVRLVLGYAPGGTTDVLARLLAARLSPAWGQSVVVDNRAGGGGIIGADLVAKAEPDGYTILVCTPAQTTVNPHLLKSMPYDPLKDFAPVTLIATSPSVLLTHPALRARTLPELARSAKAGKGGFNFASTGIGSPSHLQGLVLAKESGIPMQHIAYKGTGPAITDLLAGHVELMFNTVQVALPLIKAGRLNALAVTGTTRFDGLPDVPTMKEFGTPEVESGVWYGMLLPARTQDAVVRTLHAAVVATLRSPDVVESLKRDGANVVAGSPAQFGQFMAADSARWKAVIQREKIRPE